MLCILIVVLHTVQLSSLSFLWLHIWQTIKTSRDETCCYLGLAPSPTPHDLLLGSSCSQRHLQLKHCVTLCPANIRKSVVPSPTATSSNVSWTFTDNLCLCLASSLVQHQTSQYSFLSYWKKPRHPLHTHTQTFTHVHSRMKAATHQEKDLLVKTVTLLPTAWKENCTNVLWLHQHRAKKKTGF